MGWHGGIHRFHPYKNPGKKRRGRPRAHFESFSVGHTAMEVTQSQSSGEKRKRNNEAEMIPGLIEGKVFGFPNSIITKLRYATYLTLTSSTGSRAINVFAANGIFDPDITQTGHQPMYRDNYAALYDQYVVLGSKITATFAPVVANTSMIVGIVGDDDSTISTNQETLMEQNNGVCSMIAGSGSETKTLVQTFEPCFNFGVDAKNDGSSQTNIGSNPTELFCFGVWATAGDVTASANCNVKIEIEYTVKWAELVSPTQN